MVTGTSGDFVPSVGYMLDYVKCERLQEVFCRPRQPSWNVVQNRMSPTVVSVAVVGLCPVFVMPL